MYNPPHLAYSEVVARGGQIGSPVVGKALRA